MTDSPVVAGVDGSEHSLAAAGHAAVAAVRRNRHLHLVHAYLHPFGYGNAPLEPYPAGLPEPTEAAERMLARTADTLRSAHPGLTIRTRQILGSAAGTMVIESEQAELLFVGSRGLGGFSGLLLGSVSSQVAAHARCPVVVVRPQPDPARPLPGPQAPMPADAPAPDGPVLVGVDGSEDSRIATEFAFNEAQLRGERVLALHVYWSDSPRTMHHPGGEVEPGETEAAEGELAQLIAEAAGRHPGVPVERRVVHRQNTQEVLVEASREVGLAVVGSRGRGGFTGLLLGSVSQAMIHHAHCPVAVVRPRDRGAG